jgi:hypothetical protein
MSALHHCTLASREKAVMASREHDGKLLEVGDRDGVHRCRQLGVRDCTASTMRRAAAASGRTWSRKAGRRHREHDVGAQQGKGGIGDEARIFTLLGCHGSVIELLFGYSSLDFYLPEHDFWGRLSGGSYLPTGRWIRL